MNLWLTNEPSVAVKHSLYPHFHWKPVYRKWLLFNSHSVLFLHSLHPPWKNVRIRKTTWFYIFLHWHNPSYICQHTGQWGPGFLKLNTCCMRLGESRPFAACVSQVLQGSLIMHNWTCCIEDCCDKTYRLCNQRNQRAEINSCTWNTQETCQANCFTQLQLWICNIIMNVIMKHNVSTSHGLLLSCKVKLNAYSACHTDI